MTTKADHKSSLLPRVAAWWRSRRSPRAGDSLRVSNHEAACNIGLSEPKSRALAGKWPGAADPLARMLEQLKRGS